MVKMKSIFKLMIVFGLVFGIFFSLGAFLPGLMISDDEQSIDEPVIADKERINILLLGIDARPGETKTRSDTIILASIDPELNKVALVSIPRDTRIKLKDSYVDKINGANTVGGPKLVAEKVEEIIGENIDYYVEMDFNGFKKIIDTIGGVDINVDQRMYKPLEDIDLRPGQQRLDGSQALAFVRYRDYALGDIERTEHQQVFLKALGNELLRARNIVKLPALVKVVKENIDTNLTTADMLKMASWAPGFNGDSIIAQTLPGYFWDKRDDYGNLTQSYWIADQDKTEGLLEKMLAGQTVAVVSDAPYTNNPPNKVKVQPSSDTEPEQTVEELNWERSQLPSAGHGDQKKV